MTEFLAYRKETENKFRWDTVIDGVKFSLYIPKWRVPETAPSTICVKIYPLAQWPAGAKKYTRSQIEQQPHLKREKIVAQVIKCRDHTKTVRFDPVGEPENWEIGSPYIPETALPDTAITELIVEIEWR